MNFQKSKSYLNLKENAISDNFILEQMSHVNINFYARDCGLIYFEIPVYLLKLVKILKIIEKIMLNYKIFAIYNFKISKRSFNIFKGKN